jgi:hypothetical protein
MPMPDDISDVADDDVLGDAPSADPSAGDTSCQATTSYWPSWRKPGGLLESAAKVTLVEDSQILLHE